MIKKVWVLYAVMVISIIVAYAVDGASAAPSQLFKDPTTGMEMVYVKGGCYQMGDTYKDWSEHKSDIDAASDERPVHEVCVGDFYIGKYEVTQAQWKSIMGGNPSFHRQIGDNYPVDTVSWNDAQAFISKLNGKSGGSKYRLPSEAEWEYAARSGGKNEKYPGGKDINSIAWYNENSEPDGDTHPVGLKAANGLGIYDMIGNVWEWSNDWYDSNYYASSPRNSPTGPASGTKHTIRGGCAGGPVTNQRLSRRDAYEPDFRKASLGFRLLMIP